MNEIERNIEIFNETDLLSIRQYDLIKLVEGCLTEGREFKMSFMGSQVSKGTYLFRARNDNVNYENYCASDWWYPDYQKQNRFNEEGESVMYVSSDMEVAIKEARSDKIQEVIVIQYLVVKEFGIVFVKWNYGDGRIKSIHERFIEEIFTATESVRPGIYRVTNIFAKIFFEVAKQTNSIALCYPSTIYSGMDNLGNIAILGSEAREHLKVDAGYITKRLIR